MVYEYLKPITGNGLLTSTGIFLIFFLYVSKCTHCLFDTIITAQIWKQHRKIMSPSFSQKNLNEFVNVFVEESEVLVEKLSDKIGKGEFDAMHYSIKSAMDMVCSK